MRFQKIDSIKITGNYLHIPFIKENFMKRDTIKLVYNYLFDSSNQVSNLHLSATKTNMKGIGLSTNLHFFLNDDNRRFLQQKSIFLNIT